MILNAYALLAVFLALVEGVLGAVAVAAGLRAVRRRAADPHGAEERLPFLAMVATVLVGVSVAGWPLLYLLLDSYVPQWAGVLCIQGVTRIGTGSLGAAGWLPTLVAVLQATKPLLVLATGAWLALHLANRRTRTAPLAGRVLALLVATGALALLDAAAAVAYVAIPKRERFLEVGCCAVPQPGFRGVGDGPMWTLTTATYGATVLSAAWIAVVLATALAAARAIARPRWTAAAALAAAVSVGIGLVFLREVAAPALLHVPDHRCAYCVLSTSLVGDVAIALHAVGVLAILCAAALRAIGRHPETAPFLDRQAGALLRVGLGSVLAAGLVLVVQRVLA